MNTEQAYFYGIGVALGEKLGAPVPGGLLNRIGGMFKTNPVAAHAVAGGLAGSAVGAGVAGEGNRGTGALVGGLAGAGLGAGAGTQAGKKLLGQVGKWSDKNIYQPMNEITQTGVSRNW
jgi:hypothetical protein